MKKAGVNHMKAILFDLDGVFYQYDKPINGANKIADWVKKKTYHIYS